MFFLRDDGTKPPLCEQLQTGDDVRDRRMDSIAMAMEIRPDGEPTVLIRRRDAFHTAYDGANYLLRREASGEWHHTVVHSGRNVGFWPAMFLNDEGDVIEIFHYDYSTWSLVRSTPGPKGDEWNALMILGRQGDGSNLEAWRDAQGHIHCVFKAMRFSGDVSQSVYAVWDGQPPLRRHVGPTPRPLPDGTPVLIKDGTLHRRVIATWQPDDTIAKIPFGDCRISPDGTPYAFYLHGEKHELYVASLKEDKWSIEKVALGEFESPSVAETYLTFFDQEGRLLILVGRYHKPGSWIGILRKKGS